MMREQYAAARKVAEDHHEPQAATKYDELRLRAIAAQREALHRLRAQGKIGDEAFRRIQEELDCLGHARIAYRSVGRRRSSAGA